jgi:hypothetical protein
MTDKKYRREKEVALKSEKRQVRKYDEDSDQVITESVTVPLMKMVKVKEFVEDPHQKMIFEFFGRDHFTFLIELFKITHADGILSYPRCSRRVGELPKKAEIPSITDELPLVVTEPLQKPIFPPLKGIDELTEMVENDAELAAIEEGLSDIIAEAAKEADFEMAEETSIPLEDFTFGAVSSDGEEEEEVEKLDHIEDYEDLENFDKRISRFDNDQDDY